MKKCPVCGVMMGDNVARCFMCKYDFQKAAREGEDAARKEATINVIQIEKEASGRAAEKKAEGDKIIADAKVKSRLEIEAMERQLEGEKIRLEQEYVEIRKKSLEERSKLDEELATLRQRVEEENNLFQEARKQREKLIEGSKSAAQSEAEQILNGAYEETNRLALQVQQEYKDAVAEKQQILEEANRLSAEAKAVQQRCEQAQLEYDQLIHSAEEVKLLAEQDAAEVRKQAELDSAAKLVEAEQSCKSVIAEAKHIILETENTRRMAESELAGYVSEAKEAIAAAEEAQAARQKVDDELRAIKEQTESFKAQAEEAKRKASEETQAVYLNAEEAKKIAQQDVQDYRDKLEMTQKQAQEEIEKSLEQRRAAWATAEQEAAMLNQELQEAREAAKEAQEARQAAEELARETQRVAAEDAEKIILEAEKQAAVLKEIGMSQSEKGRITQQFEEVSRAGQAEIAALQQTLSAREEERERSVQKVRNMMEEIDKLHNNQFRSGFIPESVLMEYEVEIITHRLTGEVDSDAIADALVRRGQDGWKLHSHINDEGGRLQALLGASEKRSLATGASYKEDRVILIFERVAAVSE